THPHGQLGLSQRITARISRRKLDFPLAPVWNNIEFVIVYRRFPSQRSHRLRPKLTEPVPPHPLTRPPILRIRCKRHRSSQPKLPRRQEWIVFLRQHSHPRQWASVRNTV